MDLPELERYVRAYRTGDRRLEARAVAAATLGAVGDPVDDRSVARPPVVLLPGLDGSAAPFRELEATTPPGMATCPVRYPPDRELSYSQHAESVVRHLPDDRRYVLVAESFSGPVAIEVASRAPWGLEALVLCNTFAVSPAWSGWRYLPWEMIFRLPITAGFVGTCLVGRDRAARWVDPVRAANAPVAAGVLARRMREVLSVDVRAELASIRCPILYLRGRHDRLVSKRAMGRILECRPDVTVTEIDGPHLLLQVAPRASWAAILDFLAATRGMPIPADSATGVRKETTPCTE